MSVQVDTDNRGVYTAAIEAVKSVSIKRLNKDAFWISVIGYDGQEHEFWVRSSSMIRFDPVPATKSMPALKAFANAGNT